MTADPHSIYLRLGHLASNVPNIVKYGYLSPHELRWLADVYALSLELGQKDEAAIIKRSMKAIELNSGRYDASAIQELQNANIKIMGVLYRALAISELRAPANVQGAFIPAGNSFDAMTAVGKVLSSGKSDLLLVDPYMDEKILTDFAIMASTGVLIRLLSDQKHAKASLDPAVRRWISQYGNERRVELRLSPNRTLHDRLIIVDNATVWVLTQSLNAFAARSPASIVRSGDDTAALKVAAYQDMWANAAPI